MDSLRACYGSESDEEQEAPAPAPQPSGKSLFASLPPASNRAIEELADLPATGGGLFNSLPAPKKQSGKKKIVQFRPPIDFSVLTEEDEDDNKKKKKSGGQGETEKVSLGDLVLPAPKNKTLGAALGSSRGGMLELESNVEEPASQGWYSEHEGYGADYSQQAPAQGDSYGAEYSQQPGVDESYAAQYSQEAGAYEGYEYSQQVGAYESYGAEYSQQAGEVHESYGGEYSQQDGAPESEIYLETRSYGAREFPQVNEGEAPREFKQERKRKGRDEPVKFVEIKQADLTKNRPREDQFRMTGIAFGPAFDKREDEENKPSRLHKRKHQIGSLYYEMRQKEFELMERRARGQQSKSQTMAKYGW